MSDVAKLIANTAFSFTLSGNSGISPFLTMFLIGMAGRISPEYLNLDETMNKLMSSWPSLVFWGISTILELVGKCVPFIDQIMDTVEAFIVPVLSTLGTFSAFGSFAAGDDSSNNTDGRMRRGLTTSTESITNGTLTFLRVILVMFGIILALSIHFLKMLIRLMGEGCLTQLITIAEVMTVCTSVLVSIFVREFAIFSAACLFIGAFYNAKRRWERKQAEEKRQQLIKQHEQKKQKQLESAEEGQESISASPSSEYVKMDEADQFLKMLRLKK